MSVKVRTKGAEKAGWQRSLASRTPKSIILGAVACLNFSANATAPPVSHFGEIRMKDYIKTNWKFLLFVLCSGLIGGYCAGLYIPEMYSQEMLQQLQEQGMTTEVLALSGAIQYGILYGLILGAIGLLISKKVGLWREFRFDKNAVVPTTIITIISALCLFPGDKLIFGSFSSWVNDLYHVSPGLPKIVSGLLMVIFF